MREKERDSVSYVRVCIYVCSTCARARERRDDGLAKDLARALSCVMHVVAESD